MKDMASGRNFVVVQLHNIGHNNQKKSECFCSQASAWLAQVRPAQIRCRATAKTKKSH